MKPAGYYVSFMTEMKLYAGDLAYWPNARILIRQRPLEWFASVIANGGSIVMISWQTLSAAELKLNSQVIVE